MSFNKYYKEKDYVESLLQKRRFDNTIKSDLKLIAKYYKSLNKSDEQIDEEIRTLLNKKLSNFNDVLYYKIIDNAISYANKEGNNLIQIEKVDITKSEMDYITSLPYGDIEKKILFTFLVVDKLKHKKLEINIPEEQRDEKYDNIMNSHYFGGSGNFSYKTLLDSLQEKITRTYREKGIHKTIKQFNDDGLTRTTYKTSLELLFISDIEERDDIVLSVNDFDSIGLYYDLYNGDKKVKWCEECGNKLVKITNGNKKYCNECQLIVKKEQDKIADLKYRNKKRES